MVKRLAKVHSIFGTVQGDRLYFSVKVQHPGDRVRTVVINGPNNGPGNVFLHDGAGKPLSLGRTNTFGRDYVLALYT